jgi:hypothetical protein
VAEPDQHFEERRYTLRTAIRFWRLGFPDLKEFELPEISAGCVVSTHA